MNEGNNDLNKEEHIYTICSWSRGRLKQIEQFWKVGETVIWIDNVRKGYK